MEPRRLSPATQSLINELHRPVTLLTRVFGDKNHQVDLLQKIAESHEPAAISSILSFTLNPEKNLSVAAAQAVHLLFSEIPPADVAWFDERMRDPNEYVWFNLKPEHVKTLTRFGESSTILLGLASSHWNGYVREAVLRELASCSDGRELPFFLVRLNDWVKPIRDFALVEVQKRLQAPYADIFVQNLPSVFRLSGCSRENHATLVEAVTGFLIGKDGYQALKAGLRSTSREIRRRCYQLLVKSTEEDCRELLKTALDDNDSIIRYWAAKKILSDAIASETFLTLLKRDRFMPVRRTALEIVLTQFPERALSELKTALLDPHASIREFARFHLNKLGESDFGSVYRGVIRNQEANSLAVAISGLGETGSSEDCLLILPFLEHPGIGIRKAVIRSLAKLDNASHSEVLFNALINSQPGISREGRNALRQTPALLKAERLWDAFAGDKHEHVRRNTLFLIEKADRWDRLPFLIQARNDSNEKLRQMSERYLKKWLLQSNQVFSNPTPEQVTAILTVLEKNRALLEKRTYDWLYSVIKDYAT